jgi:hypothetical protein
MSGMKGYIKENHIPLNKFELLVLGLPKLTLVSTDDIDEELEVVDMPDRTSRSGGQTKSVSFTGKIPMHHDVEVAALELWYKQGQDPVQAGYLKAGSMVWYRNDGTPRTFELLNIFVCGRTIPGGDMSNAGEAAMLTFKFRADEVTPV